MPAKKRQNTTRARGSRGSMNRPRPSGLENRGTGLNVNWGRLTTNIAKSRFFFSSAFRKNCGFVFFFPGRPYGREKVKNGFLWRKKPSCCPARSQWGYGGKKLQKKLSQNGIRRQKSAQLSRTPTSAWWGGGPPGPLKKGHKRNSWPPLINGVESGTGKKLGLALGALHFFPAGPTVFFRPEPAPAFFFFVAVSNGGSPPVPTLNFEKLKRLRLTRKGAPPLTWGPQSPRNGII